MEYINHHYLQVDKIINKDYQTNIINNVNVRSNGLIVMPTGTGKTIIMIRILANLLHIYPRVLIIAPKIILIQQHFEKLTNCMRNVKITLVLANSPQRLSFLKQSQVIVITTPHLISNEKETIKDFFSLIFIDEIHNVHYSYPYIDIKNINAIKYGLTASVTASKLKFIKYFLNSSLMYNYTQLETRESEKIYVDLPSELINIISEFKKKLKTYMNLINVKSIVPQKILSIKTYPTYTVGLKCIKLNYLITLLSTQPLSVAYKYLEKTKWDNLFLKKDVGKCVNIFKTVKNITEDPKINAIKAYLYTHTFKKCIIFTKFIKTAELLHDTLKELYATHLLIGQNKYISRLSQLEVVKNFKTCTQGILISTSVGYEGIDIPGADLVLIYESTHTITQFIQQRGRTGRDGAVGKVVCFIYRYTLEDIKYKQNSRLV